jgi:hypothetical protein
MIMKIENQSTTQSISEYTGTCEGKTPTASAKNLRPSTYAVEAENICQRHNKLVHGLRKTHEVACKSLGVGDASGLHKLGYLNI